MGLPAQTPLRELIRKFKALGWEGPVTGGKHRFMRLGTRKVRIPDPHGSDVHVSLLKEILQQGNISEEEWVKAE